MAERICPNCEKTVPDWNYCAECGKPLPQATGGELSTPDAPPAADESVTAAPCPPETQEPEPPAPPPPPPPQATPPPARAVRAPAMPIDDQLRCPDCGEAVYEGDRVCWNCSRRLEAIGDVVEQAGAPVAAPESGAPTARVMPPQPASVSTAAPSSAAQPQQPLPGRASSEAMSYAWWSFGLGLLSVFTCGVLGLLGLAALWLGVSAARRDAGPVAIAGAVFGAMGLLMLIAWVVALTVAMPELLRSQPTHIMIPVLP